MTDGEKIISLHAGYETDGVYTNAFLARPVDGAPRPGVVLLSGMGGLTWTQREITRSYARAGFVALSPDYMLGQMAPNRTTALLAKNSLDVNAAVEALAGGAAFLRSLPWVASKDRIGIMGFCLGGGLVLLAMGRTEAFQAGIVYHQSLFPDVRELAGIDCNLQCHYGTEDHSTPREEVEAIQREARVVVAHAGIGSVIDALKAGRSLVVVPRLRRFGEHNNDHQLDLARAVERRAWGRVVTDIDELEDACAHPPPAHTNYSPAKDELIRAVRATIEAGLAKRGRAHAE